MPINKLYLLPAAGVTVKDPLTLKPLKKTGEWKPDNRFWRDKVRDEDVAEGKPPKDAADGSGAGDAGQDSDPVKALLSGTVDQVKAGMGELSDAALASALAAEAASASPRAKATAAIQGEIDRRKAAK